MCSVLLLGYPWTIVHPTTILCLAIVVEDLSFQCSQPPRFQAPLYYFGGRVVQLYVILHHLLLKGFSLGDLLMERGHQMFWWLIDA